MLDGIGLNKKDANGIRLLPNGKPATIEISVVPAFGAWPDVALLVSKDWEAVGIKTIVQIRERALHFKMNENNELMAEVWNEDTSAFPYTGNAKADPRNAPILTIGPLWRRWYATGGKEGVEPPPEMKRIVEIVDKARTVGPEEQVKLSPGALSHLGREPLRDRHGRADAHGAGRGGDQHQVPQRADDARQRLAAAQPGQRADRAVLFHEVSSHSSSVDLPRHTGEAGRRKAPKTASDNCRS